MLKLISGALIGGINYKEIYMDFDIDDKTNPPITTNNMGVDQNSNIHKVPTLPETAIKLPDQRRENLMKSNTLYNGNCHELPYSSYEPVILEKD
jgi:hypothetical protein